ncbi:MAG: glutathione peroxidase [Gammaproteobacteria bacterium]
MWPFPSHAAETQPGSAYDYAFDTLSGDEPMPLAQYQGKVLLVVNTASECGFTPQYRGLEALYRKYHDRGLVVIGVPSNDFGGQEPGSSAKIAAFCRVNYGVSFPMASKVHVKGDDAHPFYRWARQRFGIKGAPKWNFHKYLIDRDGKLVDYFHSTTEPESPRLAKAIEARLDSF